MLCEGGAAEGRRSLYGRGDGGRVLTRWNYGCDRLPCPRHQAGKQGNFGLRVWVAYLCDLEYELLIGLVCAHRRLQLLTSTWRGT